MVTLRQLFTVFGHDERWHQFATASTPSFVAVYLRKLGDTDITKLTDFDIELQGAMSEQPEERKVKARACMVHLLAWAKEQGKNVPTLSKYQHKAEELKKEEPKPKADKPKRDKSYRKPEQKVADKRPELADSIENYNYADRQNINLYDSESRRKPSTGTIYYDNSSKGWKNGKRVFKDCWRAEIVISGQRYRHRSAERDDCVQWLKAVKQGRIKPTDNKADWWRMEQKKDEAVRIDEIIVSQAEESVMLYEYHQTGDLSAISDYLVKRLLPHMAYYCTHTLKFGKDRTITASRQAAALLLTRITAGKPVLNFTATCKRMLRVHKQRGDFFYYENAPEQVKLMVNKLDLSALEEIWKVTKDRRI